jgi:hypothetical protein
VNGLQKTLFDNKILNHLRHLCLIEKLLIQGLILTVLLVVIQFELDLNRLSLTAYTPPIGFAFLIVLTYLVQPILLGILNIFFINILYKTKGWQVGFWLNGIFLLLTFSTVNLVLQMTLNLPFTTIAVIDIGFLSFPLGCLARFSNGGWKKPID